MDIVFLGSGSLLLLLSYFLYLIDDFSVVILCILYHDICFSVMQHYDRRGQYDVALSKIDEAIAHTPTVIDLYSVKVYLFIMAKSPLINF